MVANINKLKGKITENGFILKTFAKEIGICETTLTRKMNKPDKEFTISESLKVKDTLKLSDRDYIDIFYGETLELKTK